MLSDALLSSRGSEKSKMCLIRPSPEVIRGNATVHPRLTLPHATAPLHPTYLPNALPKAQLHLRVSLAPNPNPNSDHREAAQEIVDGLKAKLAEEYAEV